MGASRPDRCAKTSLPGGLGWNEDRVYAPELHLHVYAVSVEDQTIMSL
jgi:hypothetical protein